MPQRYLVYLVKLKDPDGSEEFYKVGVSANPDWRFSNNVTELPKHKTPTKMDNLRSALLKDRNRVRHPYQSTFIYKSKKLEYREARYHEQELLDAVSVNAYLPNKYFSGRTECFNCDEEVLALIGEYINGI